MKLLKNRTSILLTGLIVMTQISFAQLFFKSEPVSQEVMVRNETKKIYKYPWAGGMNSCQFGNIDLNLDGIQDLFVFDRNGNRIMTFLNNGTSGEVDYTYAPEYISKFPELIAWAILIDFNNDGKNDIFTYSKPVGIRVFKNVSDGELEFAVEVEPYLVSYQGSGYVNIFAIDADYPGISDIDGDGDIDILNFWVLGAFVEYHQNLSMEKYGIPDSLDFIKVTSCWGHFAENEESNILYLDTCGGSKNFETRNRHAGSTFLLMDFDGDEDKDLILGDVDYPNVVGLVNGGDPDSAYMISQDTLFPEYNKPVMLFSMPAAAYLDVDNNGINDLILSPFDPSPITSENYTSVWLYKNTDSNQVPSFNFTQKDFLQEDMIDVGSGAYPVLFDYDNDGLIDLFISNYGYYMYSWYGPAMTLHSVYWSNIALFRNTGTSIQPAFNKITHNFAGLHAYHLTGIYPAFGDLDADGDFDMVIGYQNGNLWYFENTAGLGHEPEFAESVQDYMNIDVGDFSTPQLFDLNEDGKLDLVIGEQAGNLNYYENTGTETNPNFTFVTDSLGKINVTDYNLSYDGYSTPCLFYNQQNQVELLSGSEQGKVFYFKEVNANPGAAFSGSDDLYQLIDNEPFDLMNGMRTAAAIRDLNSDGFLDLLVGNYSGGLNYYMGSGAPPVIGINEANRPALDIAIFPNPAVDRVTIKLDGSESLSYLDIDVYNIQGTCIYNERLNLSDPASNFPSRLPNGLYFIRFIFPESIGGSVAKKLVIRK
ncbi:MAG: T9SS type A sorting domain-containing protein [Bacteroidales bacterium]|nr:T9SS type A sorting domain-containing protein [Bacteroidales bacterium]